MAVLQYPWVFFKKYVAYVTLNATFNYQSAYMIFNY